MRKLKIYSLLLILFLSLGGCSLLTPEEDYHQTFDRIYKVQDPEYAQGILSSAYVRMPVNSLGANDVATDDAVTNNKLDSYLRMANGEWSAIYNPVSNWDNNLLAILYINKFLTFVNDITWKLTSPTLTELWAKRLSGEAYALRGLFKYHLLYTFGSSTLGIPLFNKFVEPTDNFNIPRATFAESIADIYADLDKALTFLTMDDYKDITTVGQLPPGYESYTVSDYTTVFGTRQTQLMSGRITKAIKARVALLAASPAFNTSNDLTLWAKAADYAGTSINLIGGIAGLDPNGHKYYIQSLVDVLNIASGIDQKEMLWRSYVATNNTRESNNFPPSLYGNGRINPTQNLVDAFPMANGYPITHASSLYNPASPYANRDPRLALYICYNGNKISNATITTAVGGGTNAKDSLETSTRTGYYLRKLLREDVNMNPSSATTKKHYDARIRYTEIYLIYAEAANEAWGPDGMGTNGFSARGVIAAIRKRAGITQPDNYLASITTKDDMRTLIRNERRLELCFEGFRFWDLRRWKANLTEAAKGVNISKNAASYTVVDVEPRAYNIENAYYGPLPYNEILKFPAIVQNTGW
jgi:starch-binding outer membrane protein, SusD/RagB family